MAKPINTITVDTYTGLQAAYDYFNATIFNDKLPQCLLTLSFHRGAYGYFRGEAFAQRGSITSRMKGKKVATAMDEIALNPFHFRGRSEAEIFSTLVHEQVHLWRNHLCDQPQPKTHHDRHWANKMEEVGLMPSSTAAPGGKRTGKRVSHYIIEGGAFDKAMKKCKVTLDWDGLMREPDKKGSKRVKYCCSMCDQKAYGKPGLHLICGECDEVML